MEKLEKVEKLRERANVSYEEARIALEENGWDLLDAMVALERSGKTDSPKQQQYSTSYDQQQEYVSVKTTVEEQQRQQPKLGRTIGEAMQTFFRICRRNAFCVTRNEELILRIPLFAAVIILLIVWKIAIPVMLIALLFGFRYCIEGEDDLKTVNAFMDSAGAAADSLKEGFQNARSAGAAGSQAGSSSTDGRPERSDDAS